MTDDPHQLEDIDPYRDEQIENQALAMASSMAVADACEEVSERTGWQVRPNLTGVAVCDDKTSVSGGLSYRLPLEFNEGPDDVTEQAAAIFIEVGQKMQRDLGRVHKCEPVDKTKADWWHSVFEWVFILSGIVSVAAISWLCWELW